MFELLVKAQAAAADLNGANNFKDVTVGALHRQTISWTQESAHDPAFGSRAGAPYGCMPTYSNWNCVISPAPSASPPAPLRMQRVVRKTVIAVLQFALSVLQHSLFIRAGSARISLLSAQDMRRRHGSANLGPHALSSLSLSLSLSLPVAKRVRAECRSSYVFTSFFPADCHFTMGAGEYGTYEPDRRKDSPEPPPAGGGKKSLKILQSF